MRRRRDRCYSLICGIFVALAVLGCDRGSAEGDRGGERGKATEQGDSVRGARILCLGDSYTIGQSVEVRERWPVQLAEMLRATGVEVAEPEIVAQTGWTTTELMSAMEARGLSASGGKYDLVSVLAGVNDEYRGGDAGTFRDRFRELLGRAVSLTKGKAPSRVVALAIPDWGLTPFGKSTGRPGVSEEIAAFNAVCREEAERVGAKWVDTTLESNRVSEDGGLVAPDGLHPSGSLYRRWAERATPVVREILGK